METIEQIIGEMLNSPQGPSYVKPYLKAYAKRLKKAKDSTLLIDATAYADKVINLLYGPLPEPIKNACLKELTKK